jgi:hypothetical protein
MWYYYIRWIFSPYEILAIDDLKISSYELRVSKWTNSQFACMLMCSRACGGFVIDEERRSVFLSLRRKIELLVERRVMGFARGWSVGSFIEEWRGLGLVVLFEGKPEFEICSEVGISKKMFLSDQLTGTQYSIGFFAQSLGI